MTDQSPSASPIAPSRSYVARHWRGELALSDSYWRNGLGLGLLLAVVELVAAIPVLAGGNFHLVPAMLVCFMLVNDAFAIWVGVGVWRSANRYWGSRVLAMLAQATVVLGWAWLVFRSLLLLAVTTGVLAPSL